MSNFKHETVKAKKSFGQHFLRDETIAQNIADALIDDGTFKTVVEIGPGMGMLTKYLVKKNYDFKVVEVDRESVAYLEKNFPSLKNKIIANDFLKLDLPKLFENQLAVIGNFPYNISSQILFKVIENRNIIPVMVGMFQREVAARIAGKPGNKDYGILSILTQAYYNTEYLFTVSETVFDPPPKVKSGVIRITRKENFQLPVDEKLFVDVVKTAFNQRRKTLRNALHKFSQHKNFSQILWLDKRAEQLSVEQFFELTSLLLPI